MFGAEGREKLEICMRKMSIDCQIEEEILERYLPVMANIKYGRQTR